MKKRFFLLGILMLICALAFSACGGGSEAPEQEGGEEEQEEVMEGVDVEYQTHTFYHVSMDVDEAHRNVLITSMAELQSYRDATELKNANNGYEDWYDNNAEIVEHVETYTEAYFEDHFLIAIYRGDNSGVDYEVTRVCFGERKIFVELERGIPGPGYQTPEDVNMRCIFVECERGETKPLSVIEKEVVIDID